MAAVNSILQVENLTKSFGDLVLFENISFGLSEGQRVGLIAKNGSGKSTLLNILSGKEGYDGGTISFRRDIRVGYLEQDPQYPEELTVLEACFHHGNSTVELIKEYERCMETEGHPGLDEILVRMDHEKAWEYEQKAKQILSQLKIRDFNQQVKSLSGGQLKRVALANTLITEPDLLILDEPTNHLDLDMTEWLEDYLRRTNLTLLMVTHDRYFLDRVCSEIIEIDNRRIYQYKGNYSYYLEKREERIEAKTVEIERANNLYRTELEWMRRMPQARGHKARYREDAFYELEKVAKQRFNNDNVKLDVKASYIGSKIFEADHLYKSFGDLKILDDFSYIFARYEKMGIVGNNGTGKSTLLRIIEGNLKPSSGEVVCSSRPYYIPQHFGQFDNLTVAEALRVDDRIKALHAILEGDASAENFTCLNDDWNVEERCLSALASWNLEHLQLSQPMCSLSGGEKTKVFLSGILVHAPEIILMDEPTNHLDVSGREKLYEMIRSGRSTLLIVSHDRTLLNLLPCICELEKSEVTLYGGNYEFYKEQKELALTALQNQLSEKEKELRLARKMAREVMERKNKSNVRSDKSSFKKGISRMAVNTLKDKAEKSTVRLNDVHEEKMASLQSSIASLQDVIPDLRALQTNFNSSDLHTGKILITADQINFGYTSSCLWKSPLNIQVRSGDRIHITGNNGSGKTTLVKLLLGELKPAAGTITRADFSYLYIDQECSVLDPGLTVFEQTERFNASHLAEHELKSILNRCLFPYETWDKPCFCLSGGEKIRLLFCCLMIGNNAPDVFILDEPTNNLDIQSVEIITAAIKSYRGTVLLISHDHYFVKEIKINRSIKLFDTGSVIKI